VGRHANNVPAPLLRAVQMSSHRVPLAATYSTAGAAAPPSSTARARRCAPSSPSPVHGAYKPRAPPSTDFFFPNTTESSCAAPILPVLGDADEPRFLCLT
jgi:hypothetical protein